MWSTTQNVKASFHIGPTQKSNQPNYYSDYPNDPAACSVPSALCFIDLFQRMPFTSGPKNTSDNFWVEFDTTYNEEVGISISDITLENYYGEDALLNAVIFNSGDESTPLEENMRILMPRGFGSAFQLPGPSKTFNGSNPLTITFEIGFYSAGMFIYPDYNINLPSLILVKTFMQTGKVPEFLPTH